MLMPTRAKSWLVLAIAFYCFIAFVNAQSSCSANSLCTSGCCSKYGNCGFGPEYCGTGNCTSTCDAKAECGKYAAASSMSCPLGVCCSGYGFCGTTSEFCGTGCQNGCAKVTEPSCSGLSSNRRTIGYYESWSSTRTCDSWQPEDIDASLWTHINYAFALIDSSNRISQMNSFDIDFYKRTIALKILNPSLKVFISVGGWSQGGQAWSTMASTAANRATFIQSAIQLMTTYGFDGIDLDWEYPAANDRGGTAADTANLVSLLKEFRASMGGRFQITATIPSSYWYMQGFDIPNMMTYLDWVNFMSYDIHGTWDGKTQWTSAIVQPHTNLTEISLGLDLLWRNNIDPSKVVLGLGFYGRSFTLSSPACNKVDCPFTGGGNAGTCTGTVGILSNAEIQRIIKAQSITPTLNETAGIKYMSWDSDQWISFDDADTYMIKKEYANSLCLGGTMVWALDQDDPSTSESALALVQAGNPTAFKSDDGLAKAVDISLHARTYFNARSKGVAAYLSAYWTSCSSYATCAEGYVMVTQASGRIMEADIDIVEDNGEVCGYGGYQRAFCMSENALLSGCAWYGTPKECNKLCPAGYLSLAYNGQPQNEAVACQSGAYAAYCCQSVWAQPIDFCGTLSPFGTTIHKLLAGGAVGTISGGMVAGKGYSGFPGGIGVSPWQRCLNPYNTQLNINYDAPGDIGGYFDTTGFLHQEEVPFPGGITTTGKPIIQSTDTSSTTVFSTKAVTCRGASYGQACQHYRSAIRNNPGSGDLTCPPIKNPSQQRPEVVRYNNQHSNIWITDWVHPFTKSLGPGTGQYDSCQRDEYPPFVFYQGLPGAYIRLLPGYENGGAGQGFKGICKFPPESSTTVVPQGVFDYPNYYLDYYSKFVTTTLGVMDYNFDAAVPNDDDDGLGNNPCGPWVLTADNGFALLTDDPWYTRNNYANYYAHSAIAYKDDPDPILTIGKISWSEYWQYIGDNTNATPDTKKRRFLEHLKDNNLAPDQVFVDEGNSTRRASDQELFEKFGFLKCNKDDCAEEFAALGLKSALDEVPEELVIPEQAITATGSVAVEATPMPASKIGSWTDTVPVNTKGTVMEDATTATTTEASLPTGKRFIRPSPHRYGVNGGWHQHVY